MRRLIVANFDCELRFAEAHSPGPHKALPEQVRQALSRAAPLLSVFASEEDSLWTMAPLESGASALHQVSGPVASLAPYEAILAWGQTDQLLDLAPRQATESGSSWQESLWRLRAAKGAAAACNDRRFCLGIEIDEAWTLPDRATIDSIEMLDAYIATRPLGPSDAWVVKAPFAASGRERVRRQGRVLEGELRVRTQRLLERYGQMVIEPWMPRLADYGITGVVGETQTIFPPHQLQSDNSGVFRGIRIADLETESQLGPDWLKALEETALRVGNALRDRGYRGPFGIDAFVYEDRSGAKRLQSLCEINARLCFGLVARAQAEKLSLDEFEFRL